MQNSAMFGKTGNCKWGGTELKSKREFLFTLLPELAFTRCELCQSLPLGVESVLFFEDGAIVWKAEN